MTQIARLTRKKGICNMGRQKMGRSISRVIYVYFTHSLVSNPVNWVTHVQQTRMSHSYGCMAHVVVAKQSGRESCVCDVIR